MKIIQLVPTISFGDAIGNEIIMLNELIKDIGYETNIFYHNCVSNEAKKISFHYSKLPKLDNNDIVIYHMSIASELAKYFSKMDCRKIMIYHNITPPEYFYGNYQIAYKACKKGLEEVKYLSDKVDYCLADSEFNKQDLIDMGYKCKIDILPILLSFDEYKKKPNNKILKKYSDGRTNILSVGRINAPNKKWENIISTFFYYKKYLTPKARLFFVGSFSKDNIYYRRLINYIEELNLNDVFFTGHVPFDELLAYYKIANIYLCMSEHEGFCVPLIEAMLFDIPVVSYSTTAIPYTLGGAGFLLENNDPLEAAMVINRIIDDKTLRHNIINNQNERLKYFETENISNMFRKYIEDFIISYKE